MALQYPVCLLGIAGNTFLIGFGIFLASEAFAEITVILSKRNRPDGVPFTLTLFHYDQRDVLEFSETRLNYPKHFLGDDIRQLANTKRLNPIYSLQQLATSLLKS